MMTLEQAIEHARTVAEEYESVSKGSDYIAEDCKKCAEEHKQLAEWLEELRGRREKEFELLEEILFKDEDAPTEPFEISLDGITLSNE